MQNSAEAELDIPLFLKSLFANGAAGGFSADLLISSIVFWLFIFQDRNGAKPREVR
ncbi:MAG: hypothetical protein COV44_05735 [Deltaproteobacteria bacterium CG11_big_fil_rev_8_21_14_0_20_45_16]|nr:MAG: hypothetical protein COV44_05735 [Deltaproteobacteria bacterium CG11_big_fil_rev_8_21_14_0_20_45_16]